MQGVQHGWREQRGGSRSRQGEAVVLTRLRQWPACVGEGAGRLGWHVVGWVEGARGVHESQEALQSRGRGSPSGWQGSQGRQHDPLDRACTSENPTPWHKSVPRPFVGVGLVF